EGEDVENWMRENYYVNDNAVSSITSYLDEQQKYMGEIPTDDKLVVEKNWIEGNLNVVFHTIYGRKVNDALCRIFAHTVSKRIRSNVGMVVDDHGFVLKVSEDVDIEATFEEIHGTDVRELLKEAVRKTELMKRRFRHVASRALMILRNYKGNKKSVGKQQMKSHFLLSACEKIDENFPIIKETYREIIEDYMDIENARDILEGVKEGDIDLLVEETDVPSPFAHSLVIQGQSDVMMLQDKKERLRDLHEKVMERIE
ncbi:MAG: hypothetical protein ABEJ72_06350, partial [Candidatus Aenigmatarchaeota archaeon]